jgi:outer membrane protein OmpA-like peptidoglycan-associated protein
MRRFTSRTIPLALCAALTLTGCSLIQENPRAAKGTAVGAAAGAGTGAAIGAIVGGGKGAGTGAAIGAVVGALGGAAIGSYMDNQAKEMEGILAEQDQLRREQERLDVVLASDVLFTSGSASLYPGGRDKLRQLAGVLSRYPQSTIQIVGHTDSVGSEQMNVDLSRRRAQAVADEITANGVSSGRISIRGLGESQPVATNDTPEGRAQNRRVEIQINPTEGAGQAGTGGYEEPH